jgi:hypothetical protein
LWFKVPISFPVPLEGRGKFVNRRNKKHLGFSLEDFFCVDPKSFSIEQLNEYTREMGQCKKILN